mmetsp:Transcript_7703/g.16754  ORF Transcript_7703/g.16754 Transcript_7703/m.16754 type:complete len:232 (-) Transcript_7703:51-746(-)
MVLLQHSQSTSIGRSMRENENLPSLLGRMSLDQILEPINLALVNGHLVRCVHGITEKGGSHTHEQGLVRNLAAELRSLLIVRLQIHIEVLLIGLEFVQSLEIVVAPHDIVGNVEAAEEFGGHFVALGGAREKLRVGFGIVIAILRFAEIAQRDEGDTLSRCFGFLEDGEEVRFAGAVIFRLTGIDVQIADDGHDVLVGAGAEGGGGGGIAAGGHEGHCGAGEEESDGQSHD